MEDPARPGIARPDLDGAVAAGIITAEQADRLAAHLGATATAAAGPRFSFGNALYYLGGLVAIGAMSLFMTLGWALLGGWGGCAVALAHGALALAVAERMHARGTLPVPTGILAAFALAMVPLAIHGAQHGLGLWSGPGDAYRDYHAVIDGRWLAMELGTLAAGAALLLRYRHPFLVMPIAATLWYMGMDLAPLLLGRDGAGRELVSIAFGLAMIVLAFAIDIRACRRGDFAFWLHLFGVMAAWGGGAVLAAGSEPRLLAWCMANVAMVLVGAVVGRRVFAVFGAIGVAGYLGHLSWRVFADSLLFPFALSALGFAIVGLGVLWQRHEAAWSARLAALLPASLREAIAARERG